MRYEDRTGGFKSLGEFLVAARKFCTGERLDNRLVKVMTEGVDSAGGVLVPEQSADELLMASLGDAIVRPRALVFDNLKSDTFNIPRFVETDRSSSLLGGMQFKWLEEAADKSTIVSDPKFGNLKLTMHEGVISFWVSNQLEDDANNFEKFMKWALGKALAFYEDVYYIWGNGVGQPVGIMNSGAMLAPNRTAAGLINIQDIGIIGQRLLPGSHKNAVWLINQDVIGQWVEMQSAAANAQSVINLSEMRCLGKDIIITDICSALGTSGDIILADFSHYVIGQREIVIAASRHVPNYFQKNQTFWKLWARIDGQPTLTSAITPYHGLNTVSPFVTLATSS